MCEHRNISMVVKDITLIYQDNEKEYAQPITHFECADCGEYLNIHRFTVERRTEEIMMEGFKNV